MNNGGDAAEQMVRISLEGFEVAAKIAGAGAKEITIALITALKNEQKTKGKARLTGMLKSGKELKVFSVQNKDLKKFVKEAKRYGVLYTVLKDRGNHSDTATVDIIARAEDAAKIQRIMERFELATVDRGQVMTTITKAKEKAGRGKSPEVIVEEILADDKKEVSKDFINPEKEGAGKNPLSEKNSNRLAPSERDTKRPSVREKLNKYRKELEKRKASERSTEKNKQRNNKTKAKSNKGKGKVR